MYQNTLQAEDHGFIDSTSPKVESGMNCVQGKLEVFWMHYEGLGIVSVGDYFDTDWKAAVIRFVIWCEEIVLIQW